MVDLAGSEKVNKSGVQGEGLKEAIGINQSLTCLGRVIDMLILAKPTHVPYRDSVLTTLLMDSLGGNARTTMLAALSPAAINYEETLSTLRWASRAAQVVNVVRVNMDPAQLMIQQLQQELKKYQEALFEGKVAPELEQQAAVYGKDINTVLATQKAQAEAMIESLKEHEEKEEEMLKQREAQWNEQREVLQQKHEKDLSELQQAHAALQEQQVQLQSEHKDLKRKGIIERLKRMGIASQMESQKAKQDEMQKKIVTDKFKGFISRAREMSLKSQMKTVEDELLESKTRIAELEAELAEARAAQSRGQPRRSLDQRGRLGSLARESTVAAGDGVPVSTVPETSHLGPGVADACGYEEPHSIPSDGAMIFGANGDNFIEQHYNGGGDGFDQGGAMCEMCMEHPGLFFCQFDPCNGAVLCKDCDADQHRSTKTSHHQRTCVFTSVIGCLCEFCGVREAQLICEDCSNNWFCAECNTLKHRTQKWSDHRWREITDAEWVSRGGALPNQPALTALPIQHIEGFEGYTPSIVKTENGYITSIPPNSKAVYVYPTSSYHPTQQQTNGVGQPLQQQSIPSPPMMIMNLSSSVPLPAVASVTRAGYFTPQQHQMFSPYMQYSPVTGPPGSVSRAVRTQSQPWQSPVNLIRY